MEVLALDPSDPEQMCDTEGRVFHCETPAAGQDDQSTARNGSLGASKEECLHKEQREARCEQLHQPGPLVSSQRWFCRLQSGSLLGTFLPPRDGGSPAPREGSGQVSRCGLCVCVCACVSVRVSFV